MAADLVLFDPAKVQDKATFVDPHHYSEGFDFVLVNGKSPLSNTASSTDVDSGKVVRLLVMIQLTGAGKRFGHKILVRESRLAYHPARTASVSWGQRHR